MRRLLSAVASIMACAAFLASPILAIPLTAQDTHSAILEQDKQALSIVSIDIDPLTARVNQRVAINVNIVNNSSVEQEDRLIMLLNGETVSDQQISLPPMQTSSFDFAYFPTDTGEHTVVFLLTFSQKTATFEATPPIVLGSSAARYTLAAISLLLILGLISLLITRRELLARRSD